MDNQAATPETGTVDAPVSMESVLAELETGTTPAAAEAEVVQELVEEAEGGQSEEEANEDDATDATETGEETAEEEAPEGEDEPEPTYKVKVDGQEAEVPLSELLKGYSREQDYTRKTMALAEERKTLRSQFANELEQHVRLFEALDPILSEAKNIDWQALAQSDPATYVQLQEAVKQRQSAIEAARAKIGAAQTENPEEAAQVAQRETEALVKAVPELSDPDKMKGFAVEAVNYLRGNGFDDGEIVDLTDHRALIIVDKARRYDALQKAKETLPAKKVVPRPAAKPLKTDGSHSEPAPSKRFPAQAPREKQLDYVVNQLLQKG